MLEGLDFLRELGGKIIIEIGPSGGVKDLRRAAKIYDSHWGKWERNLARNSA